MPYEIKYIDGRRGVETRFYDVVTDDDLVRSCRDRTETESLVSDLFYILDDFEGVTEFKVSPECIQVCAEFAVNASKLNHRIKHIAVMPTDYLYGMARMWQAYADETGWEMSIARSQEEAREWIRDHLAVN